MNAIYASQQKEVIVMDADGSLSGDDSSVPLIISETQFVRGSLTRAHLRGHFFVCFYRA
jgi:hypothetical protein